MRILNDNYFTYRQTPVDYDGIAKIDSIKGNSVAWNQLVQNGNFADTSGWTFNNGTGSASSNVLTYTITTQVSGEIGNRLIKDISLTSGHKYLFVFDLLSPRTVSSSSQSSFKVYMLNSSLSSVNSVGFSATANVWENKTWVFTASQNIIRFWLGTGTTTFNVSDVIKYKNVMCIDLTQLNDSRITDYNSFVQYYPLPYYSYTLGTLVSFNGTGMKTVGFNQWDEEWELGRYNLTTGVPESVSTQIRSKNSISVLPNTEYYFYTTSSAYVLYYDGGGNFISAIACNGSRTFTTPSNCNIIKFYMFSVYGTEYNNDICINLSSSKNGTYEPYTEKSASLPISSYFPTGMKSANTVYDEISNGKAITRIGSVDMGSLAWTYDSSVPRFYASAPSNAKVVSSSSNVANIICPLYSTVSIDTLYTSVTNVIGMSTGGVFSVKTSAYSDSATFTTAMSGVYLYYELSTYTEADFKEDIYYYFFDKGTEQLLPVNTSTPSTTPLLADIIYYDTREGETPYRKFWMINAKGDRWNLTERDFKSFLNNPQNLGYSKTLTVNRYGNVQNLVDVTDNFPQPSGDVLFYDTANSSRYEKYNRFIDFLSFYPVTLYYQLPFTYFSQIPNIYTLECVAVSLGKTESKADKMLTCPITFNGLSFYKGDTVEINGSGDTYTLTNNGDFPVGFEITVKGSLTNPYFTLEQDGELYGEAKFTDSTAFGEVYVDSIDGEQNIILKQGGSVLANPLSYQDLSISNGAIYVTFVKLARGESTLTIGMDSGSITNVIVSFNPIFRSV